MLNFLFKESHSDQTIPKEKSAFLKLDFPCSESLSGMLLQDNLLNSKREKKSDRKKGPYVKDNSFDDRDSDSSSQRRAIVKNLELSKKIQYFLFGFLKTLFFSGF
jgi:hypothetical protein